MCANLHGRLTFLRRAGTQWRRQRFSIAARLGREPEVDGTDRERATAALIGVGVRGFAYVQDDNWQWHEKRLRRKSAHVVLEHRASIERVADALLAGGRVVSLNAWC